MDFVVAFVAGVIPMLIYPLFLYWMDRYEKEPAGLLIAVFLWGFVPAAIFSLISQLILEVPLYLLDGTSETVDLVGSIVVAPITEEIFKGLAVLAIFLLWRNEFDGVFDGIIYGGLVGFGFAAIENVLYFLEGGVELVILRGVVFGLNHAFFTSLTGIGLGIARHARRAWARLLAPLIGLAAAVVMHSLHNTTVSLVEAMPALLCVTFLADWGGVLFVLVVMVLAIRREREWIVAQLADEVEQATLREPQYQAAVSVARRMSARLSALGAGGPASWWKVGRFFHILTELAYKKHARSRRGDRGATEQQISALRQEAQRLSAELAHLRF